MRGLPDVCHAFVVLQRFRQHGRSMVTDVVPAETARNEPQIKKSIDLVRGCNPGCAEGCGCACWLTRSFAPCWLEAHGRHRPS